MVYLYRTRVPRSIRHAGWLPWLFVALVVVAVAHLRLGLMSAVMTAADG
jgi:hypothetical protein